MNFTAEELIPPGAKIKVIGIGGGGGNAVNTMIKCGLDGVEFVAANTDIQSLRFSLATKKIQIGKEITKGLGAGSDPDVGREAALEDRDEIREALAQTDMVFLTAGMGGGTGTGGVPVIAQIAREMGALTVAVVTTPFTFEGKRRKRYADLGIARLRESVDTLITIPNERLLKLATPQLSMTDAFKLADDVLLNAVRGVSDIINIPGIINVDFADVRTVMAGMGQALMGIGVAAGEGRALAAAKQAVSSPLLEDMNIEGATGILINITAGSSLALLEINEACSVIQEAAHEDANIIFGAVLDESMGDAIRITVIATGFPIEVEDEAPVDIKRTSSISPILKMPEPSQISVSPASVSVNNIELQPELTPMSNINTQSDSLVSEAQELARLTMSELLRGETPSRVNFEDDDMTSHEDLLKNDSYKVEDSLPTKEERHSSEEPIIFTNEKKSEEPTFIKEPSFVEEEPARPLSSEELDKLEFELQRDFGVTFAEKSPDNKEQRPIEGASFAKDDNHFEEDLNENLSEDVETVKFSFSNEQLEDLSTLPKTLDEPSLNNDSNTNQSDEPAPLEIFFETESEAAKFVKDIDLKIDAALQFADELPKPPAKRPMSQHEMTDSDDVDVPTFLRNGIKDLPID